MLHNGSTTKDALEILIAEIDDFLNRELFTTPEQKKKCEALTKKLRQSVQAFASLADKADILASDADTVDWNFRHGSGLDASNLAQLDDLCGSLIGFSKALSSTVYDMADIVDRLDDEIYEIPVVTENDLPEIYDVYEDILYYAD